jgi:hypothetical protein
MNFTDQDRQCFVTLSASFRSISMGRQMLSAAKHDRTGFDWEKSSLRPYRPIKSAVARIRGMMKRGDQSAPTVGSE